MLIINHYADVINASLWLYEGIKIDMEVSAISKKSTGLANSMNDVNSLKAKKTPTISVVMSVYNADTTVAEAIGSIIAQTFKDWEFIIIDDCSTDRTLEILRQYAKEHNKIRILENKQNIGLSMSLNKGIKAAKGRYIARMDADDFSYLQRFEKQIAFMRDNPAIDVLGTGAELINEHTETLSYVNLPETHDMLTANIHKACPFFHPSVMIRREFLKQSGGYNEKLNKCQDLDLWSKMISRCTFHNLQEPLIRYQTKSFKRSLKHIFYSQYVYMRSARYNGKLLHRTFWASLETLILLLVKAGLYKPKCLRS